MSSWDPEVIILPMSVREALAVVELVRGEFQRLLKDPLVPDGVDLGDHSFSWGVVVRGIDVFVVTGCPSCGCRGGHACARSDGRSVLFSVASVLASVQLKKYGASCAEAEKLWLVHEVQGS